MSLDVYLTLPGGDTATEEREVIFMREGGQTVEVTYDEWCARFPGRSPVVVCVDPDTDAGHVYSANITHNLNRMAGEAGIYDHLWRPETIGITKARQLIEPLRDGLALMQSEPERFKALNPENGWGSYDVFLPWIARYLAACMKYPDADVSVWR